MPPLLQSHLDCQQFLIPNGIISFFRRKLSWGDQRKRVQIFNCNVIQPGVVEPEISFQQWKNCIQWGQRSSNNTCLQWCCYVVLHGLMIWSWQSVEPSFGNGSKSTAVIRSTQRKRIGLGLSEYLLFYVTFLSVSWKTLSPNPITLPMTQLMWRLCFINHWKPRIRGWCTDLYRWKRIFSSWLPSKVSITREVWWVTRPINLLSRTEAVRGWGSISWDSRSSSAIWKIHQINVCSQVQKNLVA